MSEIIYEGPFKEHIKNHLELKRAVGYKYDTEAGHLKRFDRFTLERYPHASTLTREIVLDWCSKKTYEAQANQCARASIIRQFGKYLDSWGAVKRCSAGILIGICFSGTIPRGSILGGKGKHPDLSPIRGQLRWRKAHHTRILLNRQ